MKKAKVVALVLMLGATLSFGLAVAAQAKHVAESVNSRILTAAAE